MDTWTGDRALKDRFPLLFNICSSQMASVDEVCSHPEHLRFRRPLDQAGMADWHELREIIDNTRLVDGKDRVV
jgi:hypothetical protein